jgi:hypothetical protein
MKSYLIGYDLNMPRANDDYKDLIAEIKSLSNTWWHNLDSTWIIKTDQTAEYIRDTLKPYLDSGDELLVARLSGEGAWAGFKADGSSWLMENL